MPPPQANASSPSQAALSRELLEDLHRRESAPEWKEMREAQRSLPMFSERMTLLVPSLLPFRVFGVEVERGGSRGKLLVGQANNWLPGKPSVGQANNRLVWSSSME